MNYNKVIIAGRFTAEPEFSYIDRPDGKREVLNFTLAIGESYKDAAGARIERVDFIDVSAFGPVAAVITKNFRKGDPIHIEGRLRQDRWENTNAQTGEKQNRSRVKVMLEDFQFCETKEGAKARRAAAAEARQEEGGAESDGAAPTSPPATQTAPAQPKQADMMAGSKVRGVGDEDVPY